MPVFFQLAGHPVRWQLLSELTRSDRRVRELSHSVGRPQSLVSYHLSRLRAAEVVSARQSSADGRDAYYTLDLGRCRSLLGEGAAALHPGLRLQPLEEMKRRPSARHARVLFLCTGNSTRSQIAEALLRELSDNTVQVASAGSNPKKLHANAVRVMRERGVDISDRQAKHVRTLSRQAFDYVITLCDRVREVCPEFRGAPEMIHWSVPDPAAEPGSDAETYPAFERTLSELEDRIRLFLNRINQP